MIPEFKDVIGEKDLFPSTDKTYKKGDIEYSLKLEKEDLGDGYGKLVRKIHIEWADGAVYVFELYLIENQVVVFFGSGV
jgi:hypothetical protein